VPKGVRKKFEPKDEDLITFAEAAVAFHRAPPMITKWYQSEKYRGFYVRDGKPKVYLPELIQSREEVVAREAREDDEDPEELALARAAAKAKARGAIRKEQIEAGKTIFADDIVMAFDIIAGELRDNVRAMGPTMAQRCLEYMSTALMTAVEDDQAKVEAVADALQRLDMRAFSRFVSDKIDDDLLPMGDRIVEIIPTAIERSRLS
jgi:hypothetical protein